MLSANDHSGLPATCAITLFTNRDSITKEVKIITSLESVRLRVLRIESRKERSRQMCFRSHEARAGWCGRSRKEWNIAENGQSNGSPDWSGGSATTGGHLDAASDNNLNDYRLSIIVHNLVIVMGCEYSLVLRRVCDE